MKFGGSATDPAFGLAASYNPGDGLRARYNTLGSLTPVWPRPLSTERTLGIIATGQSTIANFSTGTLYTAASSRSHQGNVFTGLVYPMADPVFGCDGTGGSLASALGDYLISVQGTYDRVTVVNVSFGSTRSSQWADKTSTLFQGLKAAWAFFKANGYATVKHIHQQGEGDAADGVSQATMLANLQIFDANRRLAGVNCPLYISTTTFNFGGWVTTDPNPALWTPGAAATLIRNAQLAAVDNVTRFAGPDTDAIRGAAVYGRAGSHPTLQGGNLAMAAQWAAIL